MTISGSQVLQATIQGLKNTPIRHKNAIERLRSIIGEDGLKELASRGASPEVIKMAEKVCRYCVMSPDLKFLEVVTMWLVRVPNASSVTTRAMKDGISVESLKQAIVQNRLPKASYE